MNYTFASTVFALQKKKLCASVCSLIEQYVLSTDCMPGTFPND